MEAGISLARIGKSFGTTRVLDDVSLRIEPGEFLTLVGPSGCGKSTLLRIIAGLEMQDSGAFSIGGLPVDHLRPRERNVAMVFQNYALYPHMTVARNIATPLMMTQLRLAERLPLLRHFSPRRKRVMHRIDAAVATVAEQLEIAPLLARKPAQLSGGQRQRVALARAMVRRPVAFLMDEPLSNLDARLRVHMRGELIDLHRRLGATFVYVTHDQVEAMTMSTRVALMDAGRILQVGTPGELYDSPSCLTAARFIGSPAINVLPGQVDRAGDVRLFGQRLPLRTAASNEGVVSIGLRPESLHIGARGAAEGQLVLSGFLHRVEHHGAERIVAVRLAQRDIEPLTLRIPEAEAASLPGVPGDVVEVTLDPRRAHLFDRDGRRLPVQQTLSVPTRMTA
jgi:multiple sugar transport system ATP-binding protein